MWIGTRSVLQGQPVVTINKNGHRYSGMVNGQPLTPHPTTRIKNELTIS